jgi:2,4-dienoyl-CoA reductase-like NADH-dependent reductase (Old Yellow Enzyme family)
MDDLISINFLSPVSNKRAEDYGGSFENRVRFSFEVDDAIRANIPSEMLLFFSISATDRLEQSPPIPHHSS